MDTVFLLVAVVLSVYHGASGEVSASCGTTEINLSCDDGESIDIISAFKIKINKSEAPVYRAGQCRNCDHCHENDPPECCVEYTKCEKERLSTSCKGLKYCTVEQGSSNNCTASTPGSSYIYSYIYYNCVSGVAARNKADPQTSPQTVNPALIVAPIVCVLLIAVIVVVVVLIYKRRHGPGMKTENDTTEHSNAHQSANEAVPMDTDYTTIPADYNFSLHSGPKTKHTNNLDEERGYATLEVSKSDPYNKTSYNQHAVGDDRVQAHEPVNAYGKASDVSDTYNKLKLNDWKKHDRTDQDYSHLQSETNTYSHTTVIKSQEDLTQDYNHIQSKATSTTQPTAGGYETPNLKPECIKTKRKDSYEDTDVKDDHSTITPNSVDNSVDPSPTKVETNLTDEERAAPGTMSTDERTSRQTDNYETPVLKSDEKLKKRRDSYEVPVFKLNDNMDDSQGVSENSDLNQSDTIHRRRDSYETPVLKSTTNESTQL